MPRRKWRRVPIVGGLLHGHVLFTTRIKAPRFKIKQRYYEMPMKPADIRPGLAAWNRADIKTVADVATHFNSWDAVGGTD